MYNDAAEPVGQTLDIGFEIREPGRYSLVAGVLHWRGCKAADTLLADLTAIAIPTDPQSRGQTGCGARGFSATMQPTRGST